MTPSALRILDAVVAAMQNAEEIGGPEGDDYDALMSAISNEALTRRCTHMEPKDSLGE